MKRIHVVYSALILYIILIVAGAIIDGSVVPTWVGGLTVSLLLYLLIAIPLVSKNNPRHGYLLIIGIFGTIVFYFIIGATTLSIDYQNVDPTVTELEIEEGNTVRYLSNVKIDDLSRYIQTVKEGESIEYRIKRVSIELEPVGGGDVAPLRTTP